MKLIALLPLFSYVLVTQVAGQKLTSLRSPEGTLIKDEAPLDNKEALLSKYGIAVKGDLKGLEDVDIELDEETLTQLQKGEELNPKEGIVLEIVDQGVVISGGQTFELAGPNKELSEKTVQEVDSLFTNARGCPQRPGFGYVNDGYLTIRVGWWFRFRVSCRERCCARQWQCVGNQCRLSCGRFTYIVRTNSFFCCSISGRTVDPFPFGRCANRFLCAA